MQRQQQGVGRGGDFTGAHSSCFGLVLLLCCTRVRGLWQEYEVCLLVKQGERLTATDQIKWSVFHRYSEFEAFDKALRERFGWQVQGIKLPPKKTFGSKSPDFVEKRRGALQAYLREVMVRAVYVCMSVCLSVSVSVSVSLSMSLSFCISFSVSLPLWAFACLCLPVSVSVRVSSSLLRSCCACPKNHAPLTLGAVRAFAVCTRLSAASPISTHTLGSKALRISSTGKAGLTYAHWVESHAARVWKCDRVWLVCAGNEAGGPSRRVSSRV